jgi:hypothetical protein
MGRLARAGQLRPDEGRVILDVPTFVSPATTADLADVVSALGQNPALWAAAKVQLAMGKSWAARDERGKAVAIVGVVPLNPDGDAECWFGATPDAARFLLAMIRAVRLTLAGARYRSIRVNVTTPEGARLARLCGLTGDADEPRQQLGQRAAGAVAPGSGVG